MSLKFTSIVFALQLIALGATNSNLWIACVGNQTELKKVVGLRESPQSFCLNEDRKNVESCSGVEKPDACRTEASNPDKQNPDIKIERATNESLIYNQKARTLCYKPQLKNESDAGVYRGVLADVVIGKYPHEYGAFLGCVLKRPVPIKTLESLFSCIDFPDDWIIPEKEDHLKVKSHAIPMTPNGNITDSGYLKLSDLKWVPNSSDSYWPQIRLYILYIIIFTAIVFASAVVIVICWKC